MGLEELVVLLVLEAESEKAALALEPAEEPVDDIAVVESSRSARLRVDELIVRASNVAAGGVDMMA